MKLSCVIPAYKDKWVVPTIDSLLDNSELGDEMEVVVVLDGFEPDFELKKDPRIVYVHSGRNRGMRESINQGVRIARGEFILRSDQHCMFSKGYDRILTRDCRKDWIMTCTRYFLDPEKWEIMDIEPVNYEKLVIQGGKKFAGMRWRSRDKERKKKKIDQTMAMQGSMWIMPRKWWIDVIKELQTEGYGQMYQDSHEMIFKTWKAGGKMVLNKNTWFAHKHRTFTQGRHEGTKENPAIREESGLYCLKVWKDYYEKEIKPRFKI
jgi:glycosyltransferase involved in cell wall biosynthesis